MRIRIIFLFLGIALYAQDYSVSNIPSYLLENANAVVRLSKENVTFNDVDEMLIEVDRAITVLNKEGDAAAQDLIYYRPSSKPKDYYAYFYDANGQEVKKTKKRNYKDYAAVDGISLYSEDRVLVNPYKPNFYPYTIVYHHEILNKNTAFFPDFYPINNYGLAIEESTFTVTNNSKINIKEKVYNSKYFKPIKVLKNNQSTSYSLNNQKALRKVNLSPSFKSLTSKVLLFPQVFELEHQQAKVDNWDDFGKWMYWDLIKNRQELTPSDKEKVHLLTDGLNSDEEKVKILYHYMQDKTRYISINIGIGGWQPSTAKEVSTLGYGDCKGLANYMMALLKEANINSNYTLVYGNSNYNQNIENFVSLQGNHAILNVPLNKDTIWLECTNQKISPGELGRFTSNRKALSINDKGGKIVKTKAYSYKDNHLVVDVLGRLDNNGTLDLNFESSSFGVLYADQIHNSYLTKDEKYNYLKTTYAPSSSVILSDYHIKNDYTKAEYSEKFHLHYTNYFSALGNEVIYSLFPYQIFQVNIEKEERELPINIKQGYHEEHSFKVKVPDGFDIHYTIEPIILKNEFGSYQLNYEVKSGYLIIKRDFKIFKGEYSPNNYNKLIDFFNEIKKADATKILFSI